jgi:hypothetical protein
MPKEELVTAVLRAIADLRAELPPLNFGEVYERTTAHAFACHLARYFPNWNVDCEYDRDGTLFKMLEGIRECEEERKTNRIYPDIIIHHRGGRGRESNLLVIEMKRDAVEDPCDRLKLELMTATDGRYQYQTGLYLNIDNGVFHQTWYENGQRSE